MNYKKTDVQDYVAGDKCIAHRDGTFTAKRFFFYRHGGCEDMFAEKIISSLEERGMRVAILETSENWNAWPKDSWWEVKFEVY